MDAESQLLHRLGVPLAPRPVHSKPARVESYAEISRAVDIVMGQMDDWVPICAWVRSLAHHWPSRFEAIFGSRGPAIIEALTNRIDDRGRYLKLRRIATENLASITWPERAA